ncbi:HAMP domain-containing protein [Planotetraspora sp. A-T 1434]|uniref:HAMP domain-containing protein n=1 Tax=Planotetraspora sp. A-T 1434 TaxID=2979219 RepID=UPI0021C1D88A|nr:HAMP domain-containing protein [Planotetraspora sp. A-T 1434]MCT9935330.1 HAMP domain-containing protein [Planotetraspora sp. A-T 1434]
MWVPWVCGLLALLTIAGAELVVGGRLDPGSPVPAMVLNGQRSSTISKARLVRMVLRFAERDLDELADDLSRAADPASFDERLRDFQSKRHNPYRSVYVIDTSGRLLAQAGGQPHPDRLPVVPTSAGTTDAIDIDHVPVTLHYAPLGFGKNGRAVAVGEYDLTGLRRAVHVRGTATAWVVNSRGEVIYSTAGFTAFQQLATPELRAAALSPAARSQVSLLGQAGSQQIVVSVPIRGRGRWPGPLWRLVIARNADTVGLPGSRTRDQALLAALATTVVTVGAFGWLYVIWLRPLRRLVRDAERLAAGDLSTRVEVRRYDELGLAARALEGVRVALIRDAAPAAGPGLDRRLSLPPGREL